MRERFVLDVFLSRLANVSVIVGVFAAGLAYVSERQLARIDASLAYITRFNEGHILDARNIIYHNLSGPIVAQLQRMDLEQLDRYILRRLQLEEHANYRSAVVVLVDFFDSAEVCVRQNVCDGDVLQGQFGPYAANFHCIFQTFITNQRDPDVGGLTDFGAGLEHFLGEHISDCARR